MTLLSPLHFLMILNSVSEPFTMKRSRSRMSRPVIVHILTFYVLKCWSDRPKCCTLVYGNVILLEMIILTATRDYLKGIAMLKIDSIIDSALSTLISTIIEAGVLRI